MQRTPALHSGFLRSAAEFPDRPALEVDGRAIRYGELASRARALAATLERSAPDGGPPLTAVFAYRTVTAFAGVLAALFRGHGYVPLNRKFPADRTRVMLERSGCRALIVDGDSAAQLDEVLAGIGESLLLVLPESDDVSELASRWPQHTVLGARDLAAAEACEPPADVEPRSIAYLLFTSGSTGIPKGVMVAHENAREFIDTMVARYEVTEEDRLSQTFDMTFDLSVFDMFVAWERGACVCCLPPASLLKPAAFIESSRLTMWFSVPSLVLLMKRLGMLTPARYPQLRWSLFCGEPLPASAAAAWAEAAPGSIVENLYGPTEVTIACTLYRWDPQRSPDECLHGLVPIGDPYPGMDALIADGDLQEVTPGEEGELLLTGPQVTLGYWRDPDKTAAAFVRPPGRPAVHYRTGDLVRRPMNGGPIVFVGRVDNQVKVGGYRVELGEVEQSLREASGIDEVIAVPWPRTESSASGLTAFVQGEGVDAAEVRRRMAKRLPGYMVPRAIHALPELPLNVNGKFDRRALLARLEESA